LDDLIKQSLISQLESIKADDEEEDREALEKHQLDAMNATADLEKETEENKEKMDKLEAKLDKLKIDNDNVLKGKHPPKKPSAGKADETSESSADEQK
jgi:predicted RNase H-like nuclease (RuvC/YqgF family)